MATGTPPTSAESTQETPNVAQPPSAAPDAPTILDHVVMALLVRLAVPLQTAASTLAV